MTIEDWLRNAQEDAERRGLEPLKAMLDTLARSTINLRKAADQRLTSPKQQDGDRADR